MCIGMCVDVDGCVVLFKPVVNYMCNVCCVVCHVWSSVAVLRRSVACAFVCWKMLCSIGFFGRFVSCVMCDTRTTMLCFVYSYIISAKQTTIDIYRVYTRRYTSISRYARL